MKTEAKKEMSEIFPLRLLTRKEKRIVGTRRPIPPRPPVFLGIEERPVPNLDPFAIPKRKRSKKPTSRKE